MYNGMLGAVGGIIGKAIFAYFVSVLVLPLFSGKKPFKGMGGGFNSFIKGLVVKSAKEAGQLVIGIGLALIMFNFITGNASTVNSMAGFVGLLLTVRSLWSRNGFIWGLLSSLVNKLAKGRVPTQIIVSRLLSGIAAGNAAGVVLSTLKVPYLPYVLGSLLLILGLVLAIVVKKGKEAELI
jgi:hypothetical protein